MKKLLFITSALALTMVAACKKDKKTGTTEAPFTVEQTQNASYIYFGGTWCGPCGAYGKPTKQALHEDAKNANAVFISFQVKWSYTDPFATAQTDATAASFGVTGVPSAFIAGGTTFSKFGFSSNNATNQSTQQATFNTVYGQTARVNGKAFPTISGKTLTVKTKNKFFVTTTDTFFVNVYLTESNLIATQYLDGSTKQNIHDFIWRAQSSANIWGDQLVIAPTNGQIVENTVTFALNDSWTKTNCDVNVIIWKKVNGKYGIENCYKTKMVN